MLKEVGFRIRLPLHKDTEDSRKSLDKWRKGFSDMEKKELPKLHTRTKSFLKDTSTGLQEVSRHAERAGSSISRSFKEGLEGLNRFNEKLHRTRERIFGLKEAFEATLVGGAVFYAGEKLIEAGRTEARTKRTLRREFGGVEGKRINEVAEQLAKGAGLEGADAAQALIPLARTLRDEVQGGARFRGMKGPLTEKAAAAMRARNLEFGASLVKTMSVLNPEMSAGEVGGVLNNALTGPEGIRQMIAAFQLNKNSQKLSRFNEAGKVVQALSPEERKRFGITKAGQFMEQGDLVKLMLERSGFTTKAAEEEMRTFDFQIKAVGNSIKSTFGVIGESMLSQFDGGLNKGLTLSQRLQTYLEEHKEGIQQIGKSLGSAAKAVGEFAGKLPQIGGFLSEHKTALLTLGGAFLGFKALAGVGGMLEKAKSVPGFGSAFGALGGTKPIPVYVVNGPSGTSLPGLGGVAGSAGGKLGRILGSAGAVLAAGAAGYAVGSFIDEKTGASDKIAGFLNRGNARRADEAGDQFREALAKAAAERAAKVKDLEAQGIAHGMAVAMAQNPQQAQTINVVLPDGRVLASVVNEHNVRGLKNLTANGAAPLHRE